MEIDKEYEEYDSSYKHKIEELQPTWKNPPTVNKLKQDVQDAESDFGIHVSSVSNWLNARDAKLKVKIPKGQSVVTPKIIRKQNEWRYTALTEPLLASEDMYDVLAQTEQDTDSATDNAIILNKQFKEDIKRTEFIDEYVRTAVDEGVVIVRVGWEYEEDEVTYQQPIKQQILPPEVQEQLQQAMQAAQQGQMDPMQFQQMQQQAQQQLITIDTDQFKEVKETTVVVNIPTLEVCDFDKVMIDPTCKGDMNKAEFIVYQFKSSKAELREDPKYKNIDAIMSTDDDDNQIGTNDSTIQESSFEFKDEPRKKITVTEYWGYWDIDGDGTTMPIVAAYVGSVMIRLEENPFPDKKPPFIKAVYLPKRRDVYGGEPDAVLTEENQDVIGAVTRGMIDLMGKSANAQQGISSNALDPAQKLRFEQGKDFMYNPDVDPTKAFWMAKYPEIPRSAMEVISYQTGDAEGLSGSRPWGGSSATSSLGVSATEARAATDATAKRELGILRRLSAGIVDIGKKIMAMNAVNLSDEEIIRMTDGQFVKIKRDNLAGKFDLNLSISTPEVDNEQAQDLGFMLQTIGPNMDPGLQSKILGKIARLKKMPGLAADIENYQPEPDPKEEKVKELQIQLLEAQVANERAKGTENQADTTLKNAKADTEIAKARALQSTADKSDLDFVQQKDGTNEKRSEMGKEADHKRAGEMENQKAVNAIDDKQVAAALDKENPLIGSSSPTPAKGGSGLGKPKVFNANNHYQKTLPNVLPGMDTPEENMDDSLVNRQM